MLTLPPLPTISSFVQPPRGRSVKDASRSRMKLVNRLGRSELSFVLDNDSSLFDSLVTKLCQHVDQFAECGEMTLTSIESSLHEALSNALFHGNLELTSDLRVGDDRAFHDLAEQRLAQSPFRDRKIHIRQVLSRFHVVFSIRDEGPGFDPATVPDPVQPGRIDKPFGRGLTIMRHCMTRVSFNAKGNQVTMIKRLGTIADAE